MVSTATSANSHRVKAPRAHVCHAVVVALWLALLTIVGTPALAQAEKLVAVPPLQAHVTDQIGLLQPQQRDTLESVLSAYETRTGSQIAVLLMSTTAPEAIEDYSIRVADAWKLGRKGVDDGVILIVAKDNPSGLRRLRIESGRGVQGVLTDAQSKRVLQDVIAPYFQKGDFYGGLTAGVTAITAILDQQTLPPAERKQPQHQESDSGIFGALAPLIFVGFIVFMMLNSRRRGGDGSGPGSGNSLNSNVWGNAAGVVIGSLLSQSGRGGGGGGFGGSGGGGSFGGGGGGFDGGGASGNW
ncbi:TPM domain-containing protein [Glaciimonas sp. Gout2]|uniref:TPM domain-containing protein n=1 Tax=unclassified Glaciimonas TaxID=2644401 RepID=UPI002B235E6F|nr:MULTISPECIES: TPM domain-containing protein [unclassified Glaciimonas]MEB0012268.1 TPM domain-containing protein [Glaciimonas sp. Cout2]MEB0080544.1 TPM domain-containing protein [Glaciimonas sp. Gout2]